MDRNYIFSIILSLNLLLYLVVVFVEGIIYIQLLLFILRLTVTKMKGKCIYIFFIILTYLLSSSEKDGRKTLYHLFLLTLLLIMNKMKKNIGFFFILTNLTSNIE